MMACLITGTLLLAAFITVEVYELMQENKRRRAYIQRRHGRMQ